jgi:hypothetical protein
MFIKYGSALLLTVAALQPGAAQADDADGWRACADEGQTCRVSGSGNSRAVVRYGEPGRWVTRSVMGSVDCSNEAFGDPAPQVAKRCEVLGGNGGGNGGGGVGGGARPDGSGAAGWTFCAAEGEICQFRGQAEVRFGQGRQFVNRSGYGSVRCDVSDFGDPAFGVTKYCEVRSAQALVNGGNRPNAWAGWGNGSANSGWRYCAAEGGSCRVGSTTNGRAQVRFGDGRRYNTRSASGAISCSVETFGDPAFGVLKHCEVLASNANNDGNAAWNRCASEGQRCDFNGTVQVRYGTAGRFVYRDASNGVRCDSDSFGSDPYFGRSKTCEIRR